MNDFDTFRREAEAALRVALQWFFLAVPMGLLCGFLGTLFHLAVEYATELRAAQPWLLFLLPVAGLPAARALLCRWAAPSAGGPAACCT